MIASGSGWVTLDKTAPRFYGAFYASSSQALDTTLAGQSVEFNGGWEDYGFRITSGSRITIENPGTYKFRNS